MAKLYFGEFLVQNNWVSEEVVAAALVEQAEQWGGLARQLLEARLISPAQALRALKEQGVRGLSFEESCRVMGYWSSQVDAFYRNQWSSHRKKLGEILVDKGQLNAQQLVQYLEKYLAEVSSESKTAKVSSLNSVQLAELKYGFSDRTKKKLLELVFQLSFGPQPDLLSDLRYLRGVAQFCKLTLLVDLIDRAIRLGYLLNQGLSGEPAEAGVIWLSQMIEHLWKQVALMSGNGHSAQAFSDLNEELKGLLKVWLDRGAQWGRL